MMHCNGLNCYFSVYKSRTNICVFSVIIRSYLIPASISLFCMQQTCIGKKYCDVITSVLMRSILNNLFIIHTNATSKVSALHNKILYTKR